MYKTALLYIFVLLLGLFLQSTIFRGLNFVKFAPDILLILAVILGTSYRNIYGLFGCFLLGLLADLASGRFLGPNAAGCVAVFILSGVISKRLYADNGFATAFVTFCCSLLKSAVFVVLIRIYVSHNVLQLHSFGTVLAEAALSALLSPIVVWLLRPRSGKQSGAASSRSWPQTSRVTR